LATCGRQTIEQKQNETKKHQVSETWAERFLRVVVCVVIIDVAVSKSAASGKSPNSVLLGFWFAQGDAPRTPSPPTTSKGINLTKVGDSARQSQGEKHHKTTATNKL
jgi:hypothetical protein